MLSTLRLASLVVVGGVLGSLTLGSAPAASQEIAQSDLQIIPANPTQETLPSPGSANPKPIPLEPIEAVAPDASMPDASAAEPLPAVAPLVSPAAEGSTINYSDELMSVDFPLDWQAEVVGDSVMIANVTTDEAALIATQIARVAASPGAVVDANIDSFIEEGASVGRYRTVTIDGQDALVIWLSERPGVLSDAIATFIGYGNETILLFTRYAPDNEAAEESALQLHTSFKSLALPNPATTGAAD